MAAPQRALRPDCDTRSQGLDVHRHRVGVRGAGHFWKKRSLGRHIHTNIYTEGMGRSPTGGLGPKAPHRGWAKGPITVPRQLGLGSEGPQPKLPPLGRRLEVLAGVRGVTRHVDVVPSESSHVEYP